MTVDPSVVPGLLFLLAELTALAGVGYVIVRTALRETDQRVALAQGLVVGPAIWGVVVNLVMYALPGMAGAVAGWVVVLALAAVLVWRSPRPIHPQLRTATIFAFVALALFWFALASRQLLIVIDSATHLGLAGSIRAGGFPPELPWNPGTPAPYHYGVGLLLGLLAPPFGPDMAFTHELLSAYAWIAFVLVVGTTLLRRGGWFSGVILTPLLLSAGAWTFPRGVDLIQIPVPAALPSAGIRASLTDIYWSSASWPFASPYEALPNIWKPTFPLAYVLAFVVLERVTVGGRRSWPTMITLAALTGFLGLTSSTLTPIVLLLWAGLEAVHLVKRRRAGSPLRGPLVRSACGLGLAALLPLAGGFSTLIVGDSTTSGLSFGWNENIQDWRPLGAFERLPGGIGLVSLGPVAVAGIAATLARRDRLVVSLATGAVLLMLGTLVLRHDPAPWDLGRLAGHARNFALFALLLALSGRMSKLRSLWRYAAGAVIVGLIVSPTISASVGNLRLAIGRGIELANAGQASQLDAGWFAGRYKLRGLPDRIAAFVRNHTAVDTRIFSPDPHEMTYATGRPNASGFDGLVHFQTREGPAYEDILGFLEPAAVRRLGFEYIHAPGAWVENLPDEAAARLKDPNLFELVARDESESLYRVLPAFLTLDAPPAPGSYEALRQAVPASTTIFLSAISESEPSEPAAQPLLSRGAVRERRSILTRAARALSHARLLGTIDPATLNLRTPWKAEPLGNEIPDLVIMPVDFVPWMFPAASREPIWWNDEAAVYALDGTVEPIMRSPPIEPLPIVVRVSDVSEANGRISFTSTFDDRAPDQWSGQDWILIATEVPPWDLPTQLLADGRTPATHVWFSGQVVRGRGASSVTYEIDLLAPSMQFRYQGGPWTPAGASEAPAPPGTYILAMRLRHEYKPNQWRDAAITPVLRISVSETGQVSYQVHEAGGG